MYRKTDFFVLRWPVVLLRSRLGIWANISETTTFQRELAEKNLYFGNVIQKGLNEDIRVTYKMSANITSRTQSQCLCAKLEQLKLLQGSIRFSCRGRYIAKQIKWTVQICSSALSSYLSDDFQTLPFSLRNSKAREFKSALKFLLFPYPWPRQLGCKMYRKIGHPLLRSALWSIFYFTWEKKEQCELEAK